MDISETGVPSAPEPPGWLERIKEAFGGLPRDRADLLQLLRALQGRGVLDAETQAMLEGALQVADVQAREIMVPRPQMDVLPRDGSFRELLGIVVRTGHSRFPVVSEGRDHVVGMLLAKDLLRVVAENAEERFDIRELLRPAIFVPESKRLNRLLAEFRASHNHMAIVVDEYGGVAGMVTIEDVLEQIVGDIDDEHDTEEGSNIFRQDEDLYTLRGVTPVEEFNASFSQPLESGEGAETIAGVLMKRLGRMPRRGEEVLVEPYRFRVLRADNRRIYLLQVRL
jgi:magnesium and cobalt transporter